MKTLVWRQLHLLGLLAVFPLGAFSGTEVYVPLGSANAVAVVDADSDRVIAEIPGINASHGLAVSWDGEFVIAGASLLLRKSGCDVHLVALLRQTISEWNLSSQYLSFHC